MDSLEDDHDAPSDEDYDPSAAAAPPIVSSSSEAEDDTLAGSFDKKKRKSRKPASGDVEDLGFDNSGDEATIQKGRRKKSKVQDDEGVEGGLVKTRAQRKAEGTTKRPLAETGKANVDVNALWAQMAGSGSTKNAEADDQARLVTIQDDMKPAANGSGKSSTASKPMSCEGLLPSQQTVHHEEPMITIKRKYDFAGQTMEEERQVPASSAEAKLYQAEQEKASLTNTKITAAPNRPKRRKLGFGLADLAPPPSSLPQPKKLNTIEKSKLDWAAHVDKEGIAEELDEHSRAKDAYLGRMDFLDRMSSRRNEDSQTKPG